MHRIIQAAVAVALLPACASTTTPDDLAERRLRLTALVADAPAAEARIRAAACRIDAPWCATLRVFVLRGDVPVADYRPGVLRMSEGLVERAADGAALAFVVAHERAHAALGHRAARGAARDVAHELEADATAREALGAAGVDLAPALRMLERLRDEARANPRADAAGLAELDARLTALRAGAPR